MGGKKNAVLQEEEEEVDTADQETAVASKAGQKKKAKEERRAAEAEQASLASEGGDRKKKKKAADELEASEVERNKKKRKVAEELEVEHKQETQQLESPESKPGNGKSKKSKKDSGLDAAGDGKPTKKLTLKEKKRAKKQALQKAQGLDSAIDSAASTVGADELLKTSEDGLKAHISGLPFSAKESDIKKFFKKCGKILDVKLVGKRLGKATLTLADEAGLDSVLKMNGEKYGERWLAISGKETGKARGAKGKGKDEGKGKSKDKGGGKSKDKGGDIREFEVFVAGFPTSVGEVGLRKLFSTCGEIDRMILPSDKSGNAKAFACISFTTMEGMEKALEFEQTEFCGETLLVRKRVEHRKGQSKGKGEGKSNTGKGKLGSRDFEVFIGGLPYSTEESVIRRDFEECGQVLRFSMPLDEEGNHKGLAFISYACAEGMEKALEYHETLYGGVTIRVQRANAPRGSGFARGDKGQGKAAGKGRGSHGGYELTQDFEIWGPIGDQEQG
eukprot:TRINITY_DN14000_c0_g1_i1.p1 TRINITY_DN14000_c0_g1~~TRINITY_DN14000_c0_g1_i1.p1  ORF type:complete len:503 (+),score=136.58 TRINITY_DN14000_c0_g1_i1:44-1552(+)